MVLDDNRYMYVRGNPVKYTDPTGNSACLALGPQLGILCQVVEVIQRYGPAVVAAAGGLASAAGLTAALDVTADDDASATDLYPTPAVDGSTITSSFPLPGSTTVTIQGVPLVQQEPSPDYATPSDSAATFHTEGLLEGYSLDGQRSAQDLFYNASDLQKRISGLEKQIAEHERKLEEYIRNPEAHDNLGFLRNAPSEEIRQEIYQSRIRSLQHQINNFRSQVDEIRRQLDNQ